MSEFGLQLKQARERRGISLRQIASATKIATGALEALERGDFSRLPGGIFSRAFVRAYAIEVGLDPEETVRQYTELADALAASSLREVATAEITDDDRRFLERQRKAGVWLRVIAAALVVTVGALLFWWWLSVARRDSAASAAPTLTEQAALPVAPATSEPAQENPGPAATSAPAAGHAVVIQLHADASCWVRVTADGKLVLSRNLAAGESQTVQAEREVAVQFGSAGAISWSINGKPAMALGELGTVRNATITPDNVASFWK